MTWISIPCPKHTFLLVAVKLQTCGHQKPLSIFEKKFSPLRLYVILEQQSNDNE